MTRGSGSGAPMRVIVNADDLGISPAVNDAVFDLMSRRKITSATLLANGAAAEAAARRVSQFPHCSFGVHLNLTEFRPLTDSPALAPLLGSEGTFEGKAIRAVKLSRRLRDAVFEEWSAQVARVRDWGVPISHFDSHHHVHTVAGLFGVLKRLQRRFGVRRVRLTMNLYPPVLPASRKLLISKALWNFALRRWHRTRTTDGFTSLGGFDAWVAAWGRPAGRSVELMVHPGGAAMFDIENRLLEEDWRGRLPFPTELVSYLKV
jgi:chitin disaccharide deacetylase